MICNMKSKKIDFIIALVAFIFLLLLNFISKTYFSSFNKTTTHIVIGLLLGLITLFFSLKIIFYILKSKK
jgi:hypothetical protein